MNHVLLAPFCIGIGFVMRPDCKHLYGALRFVKSKYSPPLDAVCKFQISRAGIFELATFLWKLLRVSLEQVDQFANRRAKRRGVLAAVLRYRFCYL